MSVSAPQVAGTLLWDDTTRSRYATLLQTLAPLRDHFRGKRALDFGAGFGLSVVALMESGASEATGVEIDPVYVADGQAAMTGYNGRASLLHTPDTTRLPLASASYDFILCNAVFEHIAQPRTAYLREVWRVLAPGGVLVVNETPNKYIPFDFHTTHLPLVPWLPSSVAKRLAEVCGRWDDSRYHPWHMSGWRGLGYFEMVTGLDGCELIPENANARHRLFSALGIPASILDPYPCWMLRKH